MKGTTPQAAHINPAIQLHRVLDSLNRHANSSNPNQREALCEVLRVSTSDAALLHKRLAELYRMPGHVRRSLERAGADPIFLEWHPPVEKAIFKLDGSTHTNLVAFRKTAGLPEAIVKLYMCTTMLDGRDSLELEQLSEIRGAIDAALSSIADAKDIDPELADWLEATLREAESVVEEAEVVGADGARDKLRAVIGGICLDQHPDATTNEEKAALRNAGEIFDRVVAVVNAGARVAGLLIGS